MTEKKRRNQIGSVVGERPNIRNVASAPPMESDETVVSSEQVVGVPAHFPFELIDPCAPMGKEERYWHDRIERAITRFQSSVVETCLDAHDQDVEISPYTRDRLTSTAIVIYQFANNYLLPKESK